MDCLEIYFQSNLAREIKKSILQDDTVRARLYDENIGNVGDIVYLNKVMHLVTTLGLRRKVDDLHDMPVFQCFNPNYWNDIFDVVLPAELSNNQLLQLLHNSRLQTLSQAQIKLNLDGLSLTADKEEQMMSILAQKEIVSTQCEEAGVTYYFHTVRYGFPPRSSSFYIRNHFLLKELCHYDEYKELLDLYNHNRLGLPPNNFVIQYMSSDIFTTLDSSTY